MEIHYDDLETGKAYYFNDGIIGECVELGDKMLVHGEDFFHAEEVTDIHPVPTLNEFRELVEAAKEANIVLGLMGVTDEHGPRKQIQDALKKVGEREAREQ